MAAVPSNRAERRHRETIEEVKQIARDRLVEDGLAGLSLRSIARDLGVVPSALYRYFPSHGDLLDAIADDAARAMLEHIEAAIEAVPETDYLDRWMAGMRSYREWALEHPSSHSLNFGDLSGEPPGSGEPDAIVRRLVEIMSKVLENADRAGVLTTSDSDAEILQELGAGSDHAKLDHTQTRAATLSTWAAVHGVVALEVSGRLPDVGVSADRNFEAQLRGMTRALGFRPH